MARKQPLPSAPRPRSTHRERGITGINHGIWCTGGRKVSHGTSTGTEATVPAQRLLSPVRLWYRYCGVRSSPVNMFRVLPATLQKVWLNRLEWRGQSRGDRKPDYLIIPLGFLIVVPDLLPRPIHILRQGSGISRWLQEDYVLAKLIKLR